MDNHKIANYLLSEGMESIEENVVVDFITNAALALTVGAITWNKLKGADEKTVGEMLKSRLAELRKDKDLDGKTPGERVSYKLSKAVEKYEHFMYNVFEDLTKKDRTPESVSNEVSKKIKFDSEEKEALNTYLKSVADKLNNMKRLTYS